MQAERAILVCGILFALVKNEEEQTLSIALSPKGKRREVTIPLLVPLTG